MHPARNLRLAPITLILSLPWISGCGSRGNSSSAPPLVSGASYDTYIPLQPGNRYECNSGLVLEVEAAPTEEVGQPGVLRIRIADGRGEYGLYWSEDADRGTLMHGAFDVNGNRKILLDEPYPAVRFGRNPTLSAAKFDSLDAQVPDRDVFFDAKVLDPTSGLNHLQWLSSGSIYGTIFQRDLDMTLWTLDFAGALGRFPHEIQLYGNPGFGPLTIKVDGIHHRVHRAWVDGKFYE